VSVNIAQVDCDPGEIVSMNEKSPVAEDGAELNTCTLFRLHTHLFDYVFLFRRHVPDMSPCCTSNFFLAYISFVVWNSVTLA